MKIEILEKGYLPIAVLKIGEVFCLNGNVYMKTNAPNVPDANIAVNLQNGYAEFFEPSDMVKKFNDEKLCLS